MLNSDKNITLNGSVPVKFINDNSLQGEIFHPGFPNNFSWSAGNDSASQYQGILSVWVNMMGYFNKSITENGYERKLQVKSGVCELKTLLDILPQMHNTIMTHPIYNKCGLRENISITQAEFDKTNRLYKRVNKEKAKAIKKIQKIRNNIGSHFSDAQIFNTQPPQKNNRRSSRDKISWVDVTELWQQLDLINFVELIHSIKTYLDHINSLPIYEWFRQEHNGTIRTHTPLIGTIDESGCENIQIMSDSLKAAISLNAKK